MVGGREFGKIVKEKSFLGAVILKLIVTDVVVGSVIFPMTPHVRLLVGWLVG